MGLADEKPQTTAYELIEKIQSSEVEKQAVGFSWPRIKEGCRKLEHITLGAKPEDNYALLLYQEPLPSTFPAELIATLDTFTDEQGRVFKYKQLGKEPEHATLVHATTYLANMGEYPPAPSNKPSEKPRIETQSSAREVNLDDLIEGLKGKTCLIYTGAGISVEVGLPDSARLKKQLGVDMNTDVDEFAVSMCTTQTRPNLESSLQELQHKFYGTPTKAHYLLGEIQGITEGRIALATENLDKLHEKSGNPVIPLGNIGDIPKEYLRQVEVVITIGLKQNFTGLVPRYKAENPQGTVIAVNLSKPPYSYPVDGYVLCNAQDFCERLRNNLVERN